MTPRQKRELRARLDKAERQVREYQAKVDAATAPNIKQVWNTHLEEAQRELAAARAVYSRG